MRWKCYWEKNKIQIKMIFLVLLVIAFVINLIVINVQQNARKQEGKASEAVEENVPDSGTQLQEENVPDSGTPNCISNLDEYAVPLLKEQAYELESALLKFFMEQNHERMNAEIFHAMIPEEDSKKVKFFLKLTESNELVELTFDRTSGTVNTNYCTYTEEEVLEEIWEGYEPECKDVEE